MRGTLFDDRRQAGKSLGARLAELAPANSLVLALPRGGVPVAYEVALSLDCPLDVLVVRKVGVPFQPELAMGAVSEEGMVVRNHDVIEAAGIDEAVFEEAVAAETRETEARVASYRAVAPRLDPAGTTSIVVDDGLATGSTARAAVSVIRERGAGEVWVAVPVAPRDTVVSLRSVADQVVVLETPRFFGAVGAWYRDFAQVTDAEARSLLAAARYGEPPSTER